MEAKVASPRAARVHRTIFLAGADARGVGQHVGHVVLLVRAVEQVRHGAWGRGEGGECRGTDVRLRQEVISDGGCAGESFFFLS